MFLAEIIILPIAIYVSLFLCGHWDVQTIKHIYTISPVFLIYSKEGNEFLWFYCIIKQITLRISYKDSNNLWQYAYLLLIMMSKYTYVHINMHICIYKHRETYTQIKWNQLECGISRFRVYPLWLCEVIIWATRICKKHSSIYSIGSFSLCSPVTGCVLRPGTSRHS